MKLVVAGSRQIAAVCSLFAVLFFFGAASAQDAPATTETSAVDTAPAAEAAPAADAAPVAEAAPADESGAPVTESAATTPDAAAPTVTETPEAPAAADTAATTPPAEPVATIPVQAAGAPKKNLAVKEDSASLDTIEVTGSRIRRSDYESAQPVTIIKREDIERTGITSVGDLLQNLPQAGAALNTAFNNGGDGSVQVDLRNLGSNRVLVLVNGRRWVGGLSALSTSSVDLNTIPISIIDSIEILKDGASAVYGSDAIAGVINIKTRKNFSGAEFRSQAQVMDDGKGLTQTYSYGVGAVAGKSSVFLDVSYIDQSALFAGDRESSSVPVFGIPDISRGSSFTPQGRSLFVPTTNNGFVINNGQLPDPSNPNALCRALDHSVAQGTIDGENPPRPIGIPGPIPVGGVLLCDLARTPGMGADPSHNFSRYDANIHAFNYAPVNYLLTPSQRTGIFSQLSHELSDDIRFTSEVLYNNRKSAQQLAQTPLGVGDALPAPFNLAYVDKTNIYNPTNPQSPHYIPGTQPQDLGRGDAASGLVGLGGILRRLVELGPRHFEQNVDTMRIGGGFEGSLELLNRFTTWEGGAAYTSSKLATTEAGLVNYERLARAVGPDGDCRDTVVHDPTGQVGDTTNPAPPAAAGCVPFDFFGGPGTITPAMLNYVAYTAHDTAAQQQRLAYGNISMPEVVNLWAGPLGVAFGIEYRKEGFQSVPDPTKVNGTSSTNASSPTNGSYDAIEGYTELALPLLKDLPLVQKLDLSLAARYSDYGAIGSNLSSKFGLEYRPVEGLLLRATASDAFRAPSITELYLGNVTSFPEVSDPCATPAATDKTSPDYNPNRAANCKSDGASGTQTNAQLPTIFGGNPELKPETAKTLSAGLVFSPTFVPDLNVAVDWYRIRLKDFITFIAPDQIFELCYDAPTNARAECDRVKRTPSGDIQSILATSVNLSALNVEGVDMNIDWVLPGKFLEPFGRFKFVVDGAYVTKYESVVPTANGERTDGLVGFEFGGSGTIPRFKMNTELSWVNGPWEAAWNTRFIYHVYESCDDGRQDPGAAADPDNASNPTPIRSFQQYGLCSGPVDSKFGITNEIKSVWYHDIQASYEVAAWDTKLSFGVLNVLGTEPPHVYSAFASTFDPTTYDLPGSRTPYLKLVKNF